MGVAGGQGQRESSSTVAQPQFGEDIVCWHCFHDSLIIVLSLVVGDVVIPPFCTALISFVRLQTCCVSHTITLVECRVDPHP